jgi:hypothetical protein
LGVERLLSLPAVAGERYRSSRAKAEQSLGHELCFLFYFLSSNFYFPPLTDNQ